MRKNWCIWWTLSLDFWLTTGRYARRFERELARFIGVRHALLCNSGSSANLLALSALTSPKLGGRRLQEGDEVITVAAGFPTTVNPIIHNRLVPVFVDVTLPTYNVDLDQLRGSRRPPDAGDHDRPHAREPVRHRSGQGHSRCPRVVADRGHLRRRSGRRGAARRWGPSGTWPR